MKKIEELKWQLNHIITLQNQVESRCQTLIIVLGGMFVLMVPKIFTATALTFGVSLATGFIYIATLCSLLMGIYPTKTTNNYYIKHRDTVESNESLQIFVTNAYQKAVNERKEIYKYKEKCLEVGIIGIFCLIFVIILFFSLSI